MRKLFPPLLVLAALLLSGCQSQPKNFLYPTAQNRSVQQLCGNFDQKRHRRDKSWEQSPAELLMVSEQNIRMYYKDGSSTAIIRDGRFPVAPGNYRCY